MSTKSKNKRVLTRKLYSEALEPRAMMAADSVHNFLYPHDVDDDGSVTPLDALVVINRLNRGGDDSTTIERQFHDVDDDSLSTPLDALIVINRLNSSIAVPGSGPTVVTESSVLRTQTGPRVRVELETEGTETELNIRIDNAPVSSAFPVSLNDIALGQIATDSRGRGKIVLSRGDDNREHLPLPDSLLTLSPDMELVIGDIVSGRLAQVARVESQGDGSNDSPDGVSQEQHFIATFPIVSGVSRSAEYEQEAERGVLKRKFEAEIERAAPNSSFEVSVGGIVVGSVTTDSRGRAKMRLSTNPKDASEQLMPAGFPLVSEGTVVKIGGVESRLQSVPR